MPNESKTGGTFKNIKNDEYLTEDQAKSIYKRVNTGKGINTKVIQQEMDQEKLVGTEIENTYQKAILTNVNKKGNDPTQMEEWSILSNHVRYVKHEDGPETFHRLNVDALNYCQNKDLYKDLKEKEIHKTNVNLVTIQGN